MSSVRASPVWGLRCQPVSLHAASPLTHSSVVVPCKKGICSFNQMAETSSWVFAVFPGVQHHFWGCSHHGIHQLSRFMLWAWSENHKVGNCYILSIGSVGEEKWLVRLVSRSQPQVVAIEITYITLSRLLSLYITQCVLSFTVNNIFSPQVETGWCKEESPFHTVMLFPVWWLDFLAAPLVSLYLQYFMGLSLPDLFLGLG